MPLVSSIVMCFLKFSLDFLFSMDVGSSKELNDLLDFSAV